MHPSIHQTRGTQYVQYPPEPVRDDAFQLIADRAPAAFDPTQYLYSEKHDGIRVRITGSVATTRGGLRIDLGELKLPFVQLPPDDPADADATNYDGIEWDGELLDRRRPGHLVVMRELNANRIDNLTVKVFDALGHAARGRSFEERQAIVRRCIPPPFRVPHHAVPADPATLSRYLRDLLARGGEGLVFRHRAAPYRAGERRCAVAFKVKRVDRLPQYKISSDAPARR